jgi:hypothetical protein
VEGRSGGVGAMGSVSREDFELWVVASCHAQGVDVTVSDPGVLNQVAVLLGKGERAAAGAEHRGVPRPQSGQTRQTG